MKILKRVLLIILLLLVVAIVGGYFYTSHLSKRALPDYSADIQLKGLSADIDVFRDEYAIPHIYAKNEIDLYRAVGYITAQERLWQMDLLRRVTTGRLSEIFGESMLDVDHFMRALRIPEKSAMVLDSTETDLKAILDAYADGVNQYIEQQGDNLPVEFALLGYKPEKWEPIHSLNLVGYMSWDLTMSYRAEIILHKLYQTLGDEKTNFLLPDLKMQKTAIFPSLNLASDTAEFVAGLLEGANQLDELGIEVFRGSNNWALSGAKSEDGKAVLTNDMHLNIQRSPGIWMQVHLVAEGVVNVTGVLVPGQPFVISGHNDRIGWGMTNVMLDDADFYVETINPDNAGQYKFNGEWKNMEVSTEKFKTSTKADAKVVERELKFTHRGPVVSGFRNLENIAVSMHWVGNDYSNEVRAVYKLSKAKNWDDFREAVRTFSATSQNVVFADVDGNIGMHTCAGVAKRKGAKILFVPGDTDEYDWKGFVPFDSLPHSYNPPEGYVSSANNKTAPDDYPYYISSWYDLPYRIDRIREMLTAKQKLNVDDCKAVMTDYKSKLVEKFNPQIIEILKKTKDLNENEKQAFDLLTNWHGVLLKESAAASVFERFYYEFSKALLNDEMGDELYKEFFGDKVLVRNAIENAFRVRENPVNDNVNTKDKTETFDDVVVEAFRNSVNWLTANYGEKVVDWEWRKMHSLTMLHPMASKNDATSKILNFIFNLNRGPFEVSGSFHTVCPYSFSYDVYGDVNHGASERHIYMFSNFDSSLSVIPSGTSGIPASDYYCDQTEMYTKGEFHADYFSRTAVEKNAKFSYKILPSK